MIIKQETELIGKDILKMVNSFDEITEKFFNIFLNLLNRYIEALCNDYNTEDCQPFFHKTYSIKTHATILRAHNSPLLPLALDNKNYI